MSERPAIHVFRDGHNETRISFEGNHVRIECLQWDDLDDGEPGYWRHVYSALHPAELLSTTFVGVKK